MVFSNKAYVALAGAISAVSWVIFNVFDGLLFFSPRVAFYYPLPEDAVLGFVLSNITAALMGIIVSMNIYVFKSSRTRASKSSFFSGSTLGTVSSMCAGCSSFGFYLATLFGTAGVAASTFMSNYQIPLRLAAIGLLAWAYYSAHRQVAGCRIT